MEMASFSTATQNQAFPENAFDQLALSSASLSANKVPLYDVFINHRGSDVKHTLASTIYHTLDLLGVRAFLDKEALELGDGIPVQIQAAMASASLHIAIFSPNYARSPWCLAELSFMLKTGTKIIPIFYKVQPSDLRRIDQGIYAPSFSEHEQKGRYTQEKLEEWREALNNISFHTGYIIEDNEDEGMRLKTIVNCVLAGLVNKRAPLKVAKHPVGLDEFVQEFERATVESAQSRQKVKMAGIVGMGGCGKTTLAKELFNRKSSSFDRCSFVSDVRDAAAGNALHTKQEKLLKDLRVHTSPLANIEQGSEILNRCLGSFRVLIVFDDVDCIDQLDALLPNRDNLGLDSLVIVTSRQLGVLTSWGISCNYQMRGLNWLHAEQLFCWHAFLQPSPLHGYEDLVKGFLSACKGLPLSLKVLGAQLYGKKAKEYWLSQLNKISRILPADIKQRLQVSYDGLDKEEQEMFLDAACFFIGEEKSLAIAVWDGSGWSGLPGLETLVNKCLVEVDRYDRIRMHDHLRDMGKEIAAAHSPDRFWLPEQILNIKKHSQGRTRIRGITSRNYEVSLQNCVEQFVGNSRRGFKRCRSSLGLEILHVHSDQFTEELASLSEDLVWLRWYSFPQRKTLLSWLRNFSLPLSWLSSRNSSLPSWLSLINLSVLELDGVNLEELWEDNVEPPLQLRELRIGGISNVLQRFPCSIGRLKHLKKIILKNGFRGSSLPDDFCGLQSLEHLELPQSAMLSSLPARFGDLTNLHHINLRSCSRLKMLPVSFKQLVRLQYLDLSRCEMLSSIPAGFGDLINLQHINMSFCKQLKVLPYISKPLIYLEYLDLSWCEMLSSLPAGFGDSINLQHIDLSFCKQLMVLADSFFNRLRCLEYLDLSFCEMLTSLPADFGDLINLQHINLRYCSELKMLPVSFKQLIHLKYLNLENCKKLKFRLDMLENIMKLKYLNFQRCEDVEELPHQITNQVQLKELRLDGCPKLRDLPIDIGQLCKLETLEICSQLLTSLPTSIGNLCSLTSLYVESHSLRDIPTDIGKLGKLEILTIGSPLLRSLPASLGNLFSLTYFQINGCEKLKCLPHSMGRLNLLNQLFISYTGVRELPFGVGSYSSTQASKTSTSEECCPNLQILSLVGNPQLREIGTLPRSLRKLVIEDCSMLNNIRGIGSLINLQKLTIFHCLELDELGSFVNLGCLKAFEIEGCPKVEKIEGLECCLTLEHLRAKTCWKVAGIQSLEKMKRLQEVELTCDTISALKPCIQSIKKCPLKMEMQARVGYFVKPIVNFLEFPGLNVMEVEGLFDVEEITQDPFNKASFLWLYVEKVVHIAVFRHTAYSYCNVSSYIRDRFERNFKIEGIIVTGEDEARVVEAFYRLFTLLE